MGKLDKVILCIAFAMGVYHLVATQFILQLPRGHYTTHLTFCLLVVFLTTIKTTKKRSYRLFLLALLLSGLVATIYINCNIVSLDYRAGFPNTLDFILGVILVVVTMEGTRQAWGPVLPMVGVVLIVYFFLGHLIPGALSHAYLNPGYVVSLLGISLNSGVYGIPLIASANYIFLFLLFGGLLEIAKVNLFFLQVGRAAGRVLKGGPAQTAVVSSSLVGMVMGAAVANVALTGAFTIPLMKRVGYSPEQAGAIEATASTGSQITPPVMGVCAFLIAGIVGIPYIDICIAAIIPALLYYWAVAWGVQVIALKSSLKPPREKIERRIIIRMGPLFVIPVGLIIYLLVARYSPAYAAFYAIVTLLLLSLIQKETRPSLSTLAHGFLRGAIAGAKIGVALAFVGTFIAVMSFTGLGLKIGEVVRMASGNQLIPALFMTMVLCIFLGIGLPTPAAYLVVAVVACPLLIELGVDALLAHLFAFYFAIISALTPPVALAALAGSSISGGNYFRTGVEAFKLAISGFITPFLIVYNPVMTLRIGDPLSAVMTIIAVSLGIIVLIAVVYGYLLTPTSILERLLFGLCTVGLFGYAFIGNYMFLIVGAILSIMLLLNQWKRRRATLRAEGLSRDTRLES